MGRDWPVKPPNRMQTPNNDLQETPHRYRQIKISVTGRKFGKTISIPVWLVLEGEKLFLLTVRGSGHGCDLCLTIVRVEA